MRTERVFADARSPSPAEIWERTATWSAVAFRGWVLSKQPRRPPLTSGAEGS